MNGLGQNDSVVAHRELPLDLLMPSSRSGEEWSALADHLAGGSPRIIKEPALARRFRSIGRTFEFSMDWSNRVNASIALIDGQYRVQFGLGMLAHLDGLARWMVEDPAIRSQLRLPRRYSSGNFYKHYVRQWFDWIVYHEAGHAMAGHHDWSEVAVSSHIEEFTVSTQGPSQISPELSRAREADADVAGINLFFASVAEHIRQGVAEQFYAVSSPDDYLFDIGAGFAAYFSLWDQLAGERAPVTHPSPAERAMLMLIYGGPVLVSAFGAEAGNLMDHVLAGYSRGLYAIGQDGKSLANKQAETTESLGRYRDLLLAMRVNRFRQMQYKTDWLPVEKTPKPRWRRS